MKISDFLLVGFFVITAFAAVVTVLANINLFGSEVRQSDFAKWGITSIIGVIVSSTVLAFKRIVTPTPEIMLVFNLDPNIPTTSLSECLYEINDNQGNSIGNGRVNVVRDTTSGFWRCFVPIPPKMQYQHVTTIKLVNDKGSEVANGADYILQHTLEVS